MSRRDRTLEAIRQDYLSDGEYIAAAWMELMMSPYAPRDLPEEQFEDMRNSFFAGAAFVFASMMEMGREVKGGPPTEGQKEKISLIRAELKDFVQQQHTAHHTAGNA